MNALLLVALLQVPADTGRGAVAQDSALRVFLDCPNVNCDFDYFRTEITFVNWVRDRHDAQVHLLITAERTGTGGSEHTLAFIGLERFAGTADTLRFVSGATATDDEIRRGLARSIRLGLVRYAARTPLAAQLEISYTAPAHAAARVRDPWNYWVFDIRFYGNFFGEKSYRQEYLNGRLSANRVTEGSKVTLSAYQNYNQTDYEVPVYDTAGVQIGDTTVTNITRSSGANGQIIKSLGPHWSAGIRGSAYSSTYANQQLALTLGPAIEVDFFPYSQSTRKLLTLRYGVSVVAFDYLDTTIYNKVAETLASQSLTLSLDVKQPWGSAGVSLEGSHYLHDFKKNLLQVFGNGSMRLYKGLSLDFWGDVELIHNQLSIRKGTASPSEVLLRRRQLATSYSYAAFVGLRYTFGSKFANVVNPRFGSSF